MLWEIIGGKMNNKHVFWQAFIVASLIFWTGLLIGVFFETNRVNTLTQVNSDFETDLFDFDMLANLFFDSGLSCTETHRQLIFFADKIYEGALKLEHEDSSNKIIFDLVQLHRRYDLLRVRLWSEAIKSNKNCGKKINTAVYFYRYNSPSLTTKGVQGAMSNFLLDLKSKYQDNLILIPIAVDTNLESLNYMMRDYNVTSSPSILINEKYKFETLDSLKDVEKNIK